MPIESNHTSQIMWTPSQQAIQNSNLSRLKRFLSDRFDISFDDYLDLHRWSVSNIEDFWDAYLKFSNIKTTGSYSRVCSTNKIKPDAQWFKGLKMNFAENLLREDLEHSDVIIESYNEHGKIKELTRYELIQYSHAFANFLREKGVQKGDRVAGIVTNTWHALVCMLGTAIVGAVWTSCSPDFGYTGVIDRFEQVQPAVLVAVDGYYYKGKSFSITKLIDDIKKRLPSLLTVVEIPILQADLTFGDTLFDNILGRADSGLSEYTQIDFNDPLYILYSSGTTGKPKCIVHRAGGVLLEHHKELYIQTNVKEKDTIFYYTTCGWMMWNWLISALALGAKVILYDGNPFYPSDNCLFDLVDRCNINIFGVSARFILECEKRQLSPKDSHNLSSLRTILSTGSPLIPKSFDYVYNSIKEDCQLSSIMGGTDIVGCFVAGNPEMPVRRGEIQCICLAKDVHALNEKGEKVIGERGELVCGKPFPSMPLRFWNDPDNKRYYSAYFNKHAGFWTHGDFIKILEHGGVICYGRSDTVLNRGGVRIGTSEIYRIVDTLPEVVDSIVAAQRDPDGGDERIFLFVVIEKPAVLNEVLKEKIKKCLAEKASPRHVPDMIFEVSGIPRTISGKKAEMAVKRILNGEEVDNTSALANPETLSDFKEIVSMM